MAKMYRFIFILPVNSSAISYVQSSGFKVIELPLLELSRRPLQNLIYFPMLIYNSVKLIVIAIKYEVKVIHINDFYNMLGLILHLIFPKIKLITHIRILPNRYPRLLKKFWLWVAENLSNNFICMSYAIKKELSSNTKCEVIYDMPLDNEKYPAPKFLKLNNKSNIDLLYLSNYINGKGQNYAIEAFAKAHRINSTIKLTFVGGDMGLMKNKVYKNSLIELSKRLNIEEYVSFNSFEEDIERLIKNYDIVLNFSESESFSMTCLEALYYGIPLIATDCGGPSELFQHLRSGYLVGNKNIDEMVEGILYLSSSEIIRSEFSINSRKYVRKKFRLSDTILKFKELYAN
ncbi:MAG: hypothetical protein CMG75_07805 [Candidatus Marinimicrobia bacterium]|nr:hypothetical protein [Candidatus Neomarinimicrobiota bacterium]